MSNAGSSATPIISLPKGGGALQGIGEKFAPDLHTGTGNFTVPIVLLPGRNGLQPMLNLVYSTGNGNGLFGLGWALSLPGVSRKTSKGVPRYDDAHDVFVLAGAEDLVRMTGTCPGRVRYMPRTEGSFSRIEHVCGPDDDYWQVQSRDGLTSFYGTPSPLAPPPGWRDPAIITKPAAERRAVFAWKLAQTRDPFGNQIQYQYGLRDVGQADGHTWDQPLLSLIRYADHGDPADPEFLVWVRFEYEPRPNDPISDYRAGFEIRTTQRCKRILIETHADAARPVREYAFEYEPDPWNGVSLLKRVRLTGFDDGGQPVPELPALDLGYTAFEPQKRRFAPLTGSDLPARALSSPDLALVDLFGQGLPDLLEMNGTVRYWRNRGEGRFDLPRPMRDAPAGLGLADPGVQLVDANGDGRSDLLVTRPGLAGYFPLQFGGLWDRKAFRRYQVAPSFSLQDPRVRLVDLDGDGVTDAIRSGTRLECFFNDPHTGWNGTHEVERKALADFPDIDFADPRVHWADMTGDGLQDLVLVYDGNIEYWPNLGRGAWGPRLHMRFSPHFPYGYDPTRILVGDVDGDGAADLVYVDDRRVLLWLNHSGNAWSEEPVTIKGTPPVTNIDAVRLADVLGRGVSGVLWSTNAPGSAHHTLWFLNLTGGRKPYLLDSIENHIGALTRIEYAPSTEFYVADERDRGSRWRTPLPFPVQVVKSVETIDRVSGGKLTTQYRYHHGYWDGAEREFRGFGMVEQLDTQTFADYSRPGLAGQPFAPVAERHFSPPILTKTWFHQGAVGDETGEWAELDYSAEYWEEDAQLLGQAEGINAVLAAFPQTPESRRARRDALRALRGTVLRTELYALDDSPSARRPYTVTEHAYGLCEVVLENGAARLRCGGPGDEPGQPLGDAEWRVFFPHPRAQRTTQWERGDDPMSQFAFTGGYDDLGRPHRQTSVAMPRRSARRTQVTGVAVGTIRPDETHVLATHTRTDYAAPAPGRYLHNRVAQTRVYEPAQPAEVVETHPNDVAAVLRDQRDAARAMLATFDALLPADVHLIGHTVNHYDGRAFTGLDAGQAGQFGALTRRERLVFTDRELDQAYGAERPASLGGPAALPAGAPPTFGTDLGYRGEAGDAVHAAGYYADVERHRYDFQTAAAPEKRGMALALQDALGATTTIDLDPFWLLPGRVTDPSGLATVATYNYRLLQAERVTDPNGNATRYDYSPLGLLRRVILQGHNGEGGTDERPEVEYHYDFRAFETTQALPAPLPIYAHTVRRVHHASENVSDEVIESREYSDGFGRLVQQRAQAEEVVFGAEGDDAGLSADAGAPTQAAVGQAAADRVVVSGWQVYDNKGQVIEKYEPFFGVRWEFQPEAEARRGRRASLFYDPRGRVIRTVNPDGSEQRLVFGVPGELAQPDQAVPTPWETYTYDPNDLAPLSFDPVARLPDGSPKPLTDRAPAAHHFTPANAVVDALGRTICQVERNGPTPASDWIVTRSRYDVRGNVVQVVDALGREAFKMAYDLTNALLRVESIDAGVRTSVLDATGTLVEQRDSKGSVVLHEYDRARRPTRVWARDRAAPPLTLRERLVYGDQPEAGLTPAQIAAGNLAGRLYRHDDEAGRLEVTRYDFKGNILEKARHVVRDDLLLPDWVADWSGPNPDAMLAPRVYQTSLRYDALNRATSLQYPEDAAGTRKTAVPTYNRSGALTAVKLDGQSYVDLIAYNARGQRVLVVYGNDVMTRHRYDPATFRLTRLRTEKAVSPAPLTWQPASTGQPQERVFQDLVYEYDLAGNIVRIHDRTPGSGLPATPDALDRVFTYDPLYRLHSATGRECAATFPAPWDPAPRCQDITQTRAYTQMYRYDPAGNLTQFQHTANGGSFTREMTPALASNRLQRVTVGPAQYDYQYDPNGNLIAETTSRRFDWDHADRLKRYRTQAGAVPSVDAIYLYDASGQRVKKLVRRQGGQVEATVSIDGIFEHHIRGATQNTTLHMMDNQSRIALVRVGPAFPDDGAADKPVQYHLGDHLGSSTVVLGGATARHNEFVNREEYRPYGETSFGSYGRKRYRFSGKERDEESGLYYFGARYYAAWLGRWMSCDPARRIEGDNLYRFTRANPVRFADALGYAGDDKNDPAAAVPKVVAQQQARADNLLRNVESYQEDIVSAVRVHAEHVRAYNEATQTMQSANQKTPAGIAEYGEAMKAQTMAQRRLLDDQAKFESLAKTGAKQLADIQQFEQEVSSLKQAVERSGFQQPLRGADAVRQLEGQYMRALNANAEVNTTLAELKTVRQAVSAAAETAQTGRLITKGLQVSAATEATSAGEARVASGRPGPGSRLLKIGGTVVFLGSLATGGANEAGVWDVTVGGVLHEGYEAYQAASAAMRSWFSLGSRMNQNVRYYSSGR